jgi:Protein of unknown function (DUF1566)
MPKTNFARLVLHAAAAALLASRTGPALAAPTASALNDTGMTQCAVFDDAQDRWAFTSLCEGTGQDGAYGRDVTHPTNRNGRAGFSFVKIDESGQELPRDALRWRCVLDRTTGLMWEVKEADGGLFDYRNLYTNIGDGRSGDASHFVDTVNALGLCGANDWRLPSRPQLESLLDYSRAGFSPMVDPQWFPNSLGALHWTSTSSKINGGGAGYWWAVNFLTGKSMWRGGRYDADPVRLVRAGYAIPGKRWKIAGTDGSEVLDTHTRLIWRRCAEGRQWTGAACSGTGSDALTGIDAAEHALAESARTGQPWRLPNVKELSSLVDTKFNFPSIDGAIFPAFEVAVFHTGTFWAGNPVYTWRVWFDRGEVTTDFWGGKMLLVRDAP